MENAENAGKAMPARPAGSVGTGIRMSTSWLSAMVNPMSAPNRCSVHGGGRLGPKLPPYR